jgi:hypothetical protein
VCVVKKLSPLAKPSAKLPPPQKHEELTQSWLYKYSESTIGSYAAPRRGVESSQPWHPGKGCWEMLCQNNVSWPRHPTDNLFSWRQIDRDRRCSQAEQYEDRSICRILRKLVFEPCIYPECPASTASSFSPLDRASSRIVPRIPEHSSRGTSSTYRSSGTGYQIATVLNIY